jgi:hypothetical protein
MRINQPLKVHKWWPIFIAMPKMLRVLSQHPELGCLGFHLWVSPSPLVLQYWRDFDSLDRFARDKDLPHLQAWRQFNRRVRDSASVGIWHETYRVKASEYEGIYGNMPIFGLARAGQHRPIGQESQTAPLRIGATTTDEPPVEPY